MISHDLTDHSSSSLFDLLRTKNDLHAALRILGEFAFTAASSQDLEVQKKCKKTFLFSEKVFCTCAFTTRSMVSRPSAIDLASAAVVATPNFGVGTPASLSRLIEIYS